VVESIAKIPDSIKASVFIKECSSLMQIDERALLTELNKMRQARAKKDDQHQPQLTPFDAPVATEIEPVAAEADGEPQEKEIIRLLLLYGNRMIDWDGIANTYIGPFMVAELSDVEFDQPDCKKFMEIYRAETENGKLPDEQHFIHYNDREIVNLTVDMLATKYMLSDNWLEMHKILTPNETDNMRAAILGAIFHLKKQKVGKILSKLLVDLQNTTDANDQDILMSQYVFMKKVEKKITDFFGTVISK
jgi:DNA primase